MLFRFRGHACTRGIDGGSLVFLQNMGSLFYSDQYNYLFGIIFMIQKTNSLHLTSEAAHVCDVCDVISVCAAPGSDHLCGSAPRGLPGPGHPFSAIMCW